MFSFIIFSSFRRLALATPASFSGRPSLHRPLFQLPYFQPVEDLDRLTRCHPRLSTHLSNPYSVSRLESILTKSRVSIYFRICTYKKTPGGHPLPAPTTPRHSAVPSLRNHHPAVHEELSCSALNAATLSPPERPFAKTVARPFLPPLARRPFLLPQLRSPHTTRHRLRPARSRPTGSLHRPVPMPGSGFAWSRILSTAFLSASS